LGREGWCGAEETTTFGSALRRTPLERRLDPETIRRQLEKEQAHLRAVEADAAAARKRMLAAARESRQAEKELSDAQERIRQLTVDLYAAEREARKRNR
jgi:predicted  nucleic acid-binding Zn-ribbon protein